MSNSANTNRIVETVVVPDWWDTSSVETCSENFRAALEVSSPDSTDVLHNWVRYALTSILRGTPRAAVAILPELLDRFEENWTTLFSTSDEMRNAIFAKMFFRAAVTLAEYPEVPSDSVLRVASAANRACTHCPVTAAGAAIGVALAPRLERIKQASEELGSLEREWEQENTQDPPLCRAATGEIIVEFLLAAGEVDRAIQFAVPAVEERPCVAPCFLAPQGLLAGMLEPLYRMGMEDRASEWHGRLAAAAPVSKMWLRHSGARCAYLSLSGDHHAAAEVREQCDCFAFDQEISSWQRMHYHRFAARSLELAREAGYGSSLTEEAHQKEAQSLETAFQRRNRRNF